MRVDKAHQIAGVPATDLRRVFRVMRDKHYRCVDDLRTALGAGLGLTQAQAQTVAAQLIPESYFARAELGYALTMTTLTYRETQWNGAMTRRRGAGSSCWQIGRRVSSAGLPHWSTSRESSHRRRCSESLGRHTSSQTWKPPRHGASMRLPVRRRGGG